MAVPYFLSTGFRFKEHVGVSDVQAIIDDFDAEVLTADNPGLGWSSWSSLGGGGYRSPVDQWGRRFDVYLSRVTQQKLQMEVRDQSGISLCTRRINCPSTNTWTARIFTGQYHAVIDVMMGSAAPEALYGGILDLSPDTQDAHQHYVYGGGFRNTSDTNDYGNDVFTVYMLDDATPMAKARGTIFAGAGSGSAVGRKTLSGARVYRPRELWCQQTGAGGTYGYMHYAGRCFQQLLCPANLAKGARIYVPIDTGVIGEFIVTGGVAGNNADTAWALCVRCA